MGKLMKKRIIFIGIFLVISFIIISKIYRNIHGNNNGQYQFVEITKGNLESTISSTGTINPVSTVEVGTQVSGIIDKVYVDFNDRVKKGQLIAVLDTINLKAALLNAQAGLERAAAQLEKAKADYLRNSQMFKEKLISEADFLPYKVNLKTQKANLKSAKADLQRAQQNLFYAYIRSPIEGTVIQRNVEAGQTVAASLQTPTLFIIAEDLSKMEIYAQVDESDIGQIKEGQNVRFDVQTYPDNIFQGIVKQIRLQPQTISNVVNYTVVIEAANNENLLLPGMTATVDFIIKERNNVLLVPNTALRFQPSEEELIKFRENRRKQFAALSDSLKQNFRERMANMEQLGVKGSGTSNINRDNLPKDVSRLWYINEDGSLAMQIIKTGSTDGKLTEIVRVRNIYEGMQVINGTEKTSKQSTSTNLPTGRGLGRRPF